MIPGYPADQIQIAKRLRRVERALRRLEKALHETTVIEKFKTTGPLALPMTGHEVGAILGITRSGVGTLVCLKKLKRRWRALCGFHPDDVRAYINSTKK